MTDTSSLPFSTASDEDVQELLKQYQIGLTVEEARKISDFLGRDPTLVEAVIWGIQGSEHCSYKSSRRFLKTFPTESSHVILGPVEDSGIVAMTDEPKGKRWGLVISHESHNHPSQIVPYEGAATGIGGSVRDILCMGARLVGCMDMLRLGDLATDESRTIAKEVIRGIGGYGNPIGVPNLGGDTVFDSAYNSNCLVNAVALGIVREDEIIHSYVPKEAGKEGYDIIIVGKPTDRSGFGGASFASAQMEEDKSEQNTGAVQEPNPFLERHLLASSYALFDWLVAENKLDKISCKDLGAGGVVCASVEQVSDCGFGAEIELNKVHIAIDDLPPEVIACAETQERLCWICHPSLTDHILKHYNEVWDLPSVAENARASVIGKVTEEDTYRVRYNGTIVCEAKAQDITCGLQYKRPTKEYAFAGTEPVIECKNDAINLEIRNSKFETSIIEIFKAMLKHRNGCSRAPAFVHFDKNVMGNTVIEAGDADAAVIAPLQDLDSYVHEGTHPGWDTLAEADRWRGIAVAGDGNGRYGRISPYWQGVNATVEAMHNVAAVGATPRALTDCLNYGNPEIPEQLWQLEEGVRGIDDTARKVQMNGEPVPIISGNVSLYNCVAGNRSIDPTAIVSCVGVMPDARKAITMQAKAANSAIYLVGKRKDECGGSRYYEILEEIAKCEKDELLGANVPQPQFEEVAQQIEFVTGAINKGFTTACHDISEGGLLMAIFEMLLPHRKVGGDIGMQIDASTMLSTSLSALKSSERPDAILFSETGGFLLEVSAENEQRFLDLAKSCNIDAIRIGQTTDEATISIQNGDLTLFDESLAPLIDTWKSALEGAWK